MTRDQLRQLRVHFTIEDWRRICLNGQHALRPLDEVPLQYCANCCSLYDEKGTLLESRLLDEKQTSLGSRLADAAESRKHEDHFDRVFSFSCLLPFLLRGLVRCGQSHAGVP
jgi:hypothetical protein